MVMMRSVICYWIVSVSWIQSRNPYGLAFADQDDPCGYCAEQRNEKNELADLSQLKIAIDVTTRAAQEDPNSTSYVATRAQELYEQYGADMNCWKLGADITDMSSLFGGRTKFNGDLGCWDVSHVTSMAAMFGGALVFNGNIGLWDVGKVTTMSAMFAGASSFNQDLSNWDVSRVRSMVTAFSGAKQFNSDISSWNVSNVERMTGMFQTTANFSQDLCAWGPKLINIPRDNTDVVANMFDGSGCPFPLFPDFSFDPPGPFCMDCGGIQTASSPASGVKGTTKSQSESSGNAKPKSGSLSKATLKRTVRPTPAPTPSPTISNMPTRVDCRWCQDKGGAVVEDIGKLKIAIDRVTKNDNSESVIAHAQAIYDKYGEDIACWKLGEGIVDLSSLFSGKVDFNSHLSCWDVSRVTNMAGMFGGALAFDSDISQWDVSKVTSMAAMFAGATSFNQDLSAWDVSRVTTMTTMFNAAKKFNADIGSWNMSSVKYMTSMFQGAGSFSQNLCAWGSKVPSTIKDDTRATVYMFDNTACPVMLYPDFSLDPPGPWCFDCTDTPPSKASGTSATKDVEANPPPTTPKQTTLPPPTPHPSVRASHMTTKSPVPDTAKPAPKATESPTDDVDDSSTMASSIKHILKDDSVPLYWLLVTFGAGGLCFGFIVYSMMSHVMNVAVARRRRMRQRIDENEDSIELSGLVQRRA